MRLPRSSADAAVVSTILLPFLVAATGNFDCNKIVIDKTHQWDLSTLGGPRSVLQSEDRGASWRNTTYTVDLCRPLKRAGKEACPGNTRVCGIEHDISKETNSSIIGAIIPIAGDLKEKGGGDLNAKWVRLETDGSHADSEKQGLRLTMNGGFTNEDGAKRPQKAIIEFQCDQKRSGIDNLWESEDKYETRKAKRAEEAEEMDDGEEGDAEEDPNTPDLQFVRYDVSPENEGTLRLQWRTKYACEKVEGGGEEQAKPGWGFFTWFIIIAFLSTATYLIFGSWLNYNRYGARGWDLLPHGDTIRDVPYLFKDWMRRVLNTVQGSGSRGGYAAV